MKTQFDHSPSGVVCAIPSRQDQNAAQPNPHLLSDRELVDQYVTGSEECLVVLLDRHKSQVFGYIIKLVRNRAIAEDIFQETFFKVIRSLKSGQYKEDDKFLPWVMRISRNMTIDHFRREGRVRMISSIRNADGEHEDIFNVIDISEKNQPTHVEKKQAHRQIRHLVKRLPHEQKQVLIMREYFNMSFNEICILTKMNQNTALGRMRYAIINLKKMAKEENICG